jgi:hypothetical protein
MKTIIKIVVALFILTACFNAARVALNNYAFEDAVHEGLLFDQRATDPEIVDMVMKLANEYIIPIDPKNITVRQVGQDVIVDISYTVNVVLVPGVLQRDWTFNPSTSTKMLVGGRRSQ